MFGLEEQKKKKKVPEFVFELENNLKDRKKYKAVKDRIEKRIQELKVILREGENKAEYERFGLILHGYSSLLKVISRYNPK